MVKKYLIFAYLTLAFFSSGNGHAAPVMEELQGPPEESATVKTMKSISHEVQMLSLDLDHFFSREKIEFEDTGTRVRVGFLTVFEEYQDPAYDFFLTARLVLPRTQEKLQLIVDSIEEDAFEGSETNNVAKDADIKGSVQDQRFGLGLRGLFHRSERSAILLDGGVKLRSQIDPFIRFTLRKTFFFEKYKLNLIERLYWFESTQWGSIASIELDRQLSAPWLFRFGNYGTGDHQSGIWLYDHFLAFYHKVNERTAVGYRAGITSTDEPALALQTYYTMLSYRYAILPPWLFIELTPRLTWAREVDWLDVSRVDIKIESIF